MKRAFRILLIAFLLTLAFTTVAHANGVDAAEGEGEVANLLLPLVAAATAIERIIEMIFDLYEGTIMSLKKVPGQAKEYVDWAKTQVETLQAALQQEKDTSTIAAIEEQLGHAEARFEDFLKSPVYLNWKRAISAIIGIVLGLIVALSAKIQMFALLGITLPKGLEFLDMAITGLVIGLGTAPVHSLIGLLQNTKNAVDEARAMWSGKAFESVANAMKQDLREHGLEMDGEGGSKPVELKMTNLEMKRMARRILR